MKECRSFRVRYRSPNGELLSLKVGEELALRYVRGPELERKVMEVRSEQVKCLASGDRVLLVSMQADGEARHYRSYTSRCQVLAVLEFAHCMEIPRPFFAKYHALHQMTEDELLASGVPQDAPCFGWHFNLVHVFNDPIYASHHKGRKGNGGGCHLILSAGTTARGQLHS